MKKLKIAAAALLLFGASGVAAGEWDQPEWESWGKAFAKHQDLGWVGEAFVWGKGEHQVRIRCMKYSRRFSKTGVAMIELSPALKELADRSEFPHVARIRGQTIFDTIPFYNSSFDVNSMGRGLFQAMKKATWVRLYGIVIDLRGFTATARQAGCRA